MHRCETKDGGQTSGDVSGTSALTGFFRFFTYAFNAVAKALEAFPVSYMKGGYVCVWTHFPDELRKDPRPEDEIFAAFEDIFIAVVKVIKAQDRGMLEDIVSHRDLVFIIPHILVRSSRKGYIASTWYYKQSVRSHPSLQASKRQKIRQD